MPAERPRQAVVLAGGLGTRLRPLTDTTPKPMIPFHGKPFVEYLIEHLRDQGFERVLLLLGYLAENVRAHFGDGRKWGVAIDYVVSPVEDETGTRLRRARDRLDPNFLLAYCDNYWPMPFDALWDRYARAGRAAQVVVYRNRDGYTRDNLKVEPGGRVSIYDKSRAAPGLAGVDIGFILMRREAIDLLPEGNVGFEANVYPRLVAQGELGAFETDHRYYSVGTLARLPETERFLARKPAVILDRDGTLNRKAPRGEYIRTPAEFEWLPGAREALALFAASGFTVAVATNQAGIARGAMTEADLEAIHARLRAEAQAAGGRIDAIYHCPHGWDEGCACRKPKPGLLHMAQREFALDLSRTPFIGDDERDGEAAAAAFAPFHLVTGDRDLLALARSLVSAK